MESKVFSTTMFVNQLSAALRQPVRLILCDHQKRLRIFSRCTFYPSSLFMDMTCRLQHCGHEVLLNSTPTSRCVRVTGTYRNFSPDIVPFLTGRCPSVPKIPSENTKCTIFLSPQRHDVSISPGHFEIFPLCVEIQGMMQQQIHMLPGRYCK